MDGPQIPRSADDIAIKLVMKRTTGIIIEPDTSQKCIIPYDIVIPSWTSVGLIDLHLAFGGSTVVIRNNVVFYQHVVEISEKSFSSRRSNKVVANLSSDVTGQNAVRVLQIDSHGRTGDLIVIDFKRIDPKTDYARTVCTARSA